MKIIMPIAGKGTRLRPHTHSVPKSLIRVAGKPIIDYIIDQLNTVEFTEIVFIVGHLGEQIKQYLQSKYRFKMTFVRQTVYNGLGHAIYQARKQFKDDEPVLILLGDIIFTANLPVVTKSNTNMIGVMKVDDPRSYGVVMLDDEGNITNMLEKPQNPPSNLAIAGIYYFQSSQSLFSSIRWIMDEKIKTRNEYQLTDAMKRMMYMKEKYKTFDVPELYDCGTKDSLLDTNRVMLERHGTNDKISGSIIIPPVFIGNDVEITKSIIGPNTSVSNGSSVKNSMIKNSVLGIDSDVENMLLNKSLIGDNSSLIGNYRELNIGNDSEITLI